MSTSIFLATLAVCTVLLGNMAATVVITAPSTVIDRAGELETREQGPTAWICSALVVDSPWTAYANIHGYLDGGNAQGKNYTDLVLYPVMELFHATQGQSRLCVYLPAIDHCYPPAPSTGAVMAVKQPTKRNYFAIRFWGQASNARVKYYREKLAMALTTYKKAAKLDLFFVSFFSDHVREVRFDSATDATGPSNAQALEQGFSVPVTPEVPPITTLPANKTSPVQCPTVYGPWMNQTGNDLYDIGEVSSSRLAMFDVRRMLDKTIIDRPACMDLATRNGADAFKINSANGCFMYNFGKGYCPCVGSTQLAVNRKRLEKNEFSYETPPHRNKALDEIVIYSEIPTEYFLFYSRHRSYDTARQVCEIDFLSEQEEKPSMSAVFDPARCYVSLIHDAANCNQTCRGEPLRALVRKINPNAIVHFPYNCGKTLQVTAKSEQESSIYISHPGIGCYYYTTPTSLVEEDCLITFVKAPTAERLDIVIDFIELGRDFYGCQDQLIIYVGRTANETSRLKSVCSKDNAQRVSVKEAVTINFHRTTNVTGTKKPGFRLSIFNV